MRGRWDAQLARHTIEQRILVALEIFDRPSQGIALARLRVGVTTHLVGLGLGQRCFRHERSQPRVFGLTYEDRALLLGDRQFSAQTLQAIAHVDEAALQQ